MSDEQDQKQFEVKPLRGEVWIANLGRQHENSYRMFGTRPVLICSNDLSNRFSGIVTVAPITTTPKSKLLPVHVQILSAESELERNSIVLAEQLTVLDKVSLTHRITKLNREQMAAVERAICLHNGIVLNT